MRRSTQANIRILSKENVPKVASEDDEMVQVSSKQCFSCAGCIYYEYAGILKSYRVC